MATEKKKDKRGSRATLLKRNATIAGMTVEQYKKWLDTERLRKWTKKARQDPAYRAKCAERQRARHSQLLADAEFGRMARAFVAHLGAMLGEWANLRNFAMNGEAQNTKKEAV
ncbi:MAG: hypothetical protein KBT68_02355 [bacterium]|nr:hypothetical protein [Candidatus Colisoma equi]